MVLLDRLGHALFTQHYVDLVAILEDGGGELVIGDDSPNKGRKAGKDEIITNTGSFGFKNTVWSKAFASKWWETPMGMENARYHEQDVLSALYKEDIKGLRGKLVIHDYDRMNSAYGQLPGAMGPFPGLDRTFALHMMQKLSGLRRKVFDKVKHLLAGQDTRPPRHVIDPPDHFHYVKPLSTSDGSSENSELLKWVLGIGEFVFAVLLVLLVQYARRLP